MSLILRVLMVLMAANFRRRLDPTESSRLCMWVLPNDLDLNMHMNNGRYLTIFDLGRLDLLARVGLLRAILKNKWRPLVGGAVVRYRFGLRPLERFIIVTRLLCWDDKWFYLEHRIETRRGVAVIAVSKGLARDRIGTVSPDTILRTAGIQRESPPAEEAVSHWRSMEELLHVS